MKGHSIQFLARKKKSRDNTLAALQRKLKQLEDELVSEDKHCAITTFTPENNREQMSKVKEDINKILDYKTKGAMIRTKRNWIKYGEKNCSFFFKLERYNYMSKNRFKLKDNKKARWLHAELCFSLYCQISGAFVAVPKRYN